MVRYALEHGVKPAARTFSTSPQTVRLWLKRYRREGLSGLNEISRCRKTVHPQTTSEQVVQHIIQLRQGHPGYGQDAIARLLARQGIRISGKTVGKILHKHGLIKSKAKPTPTQIVVQKTLFPFDKVQVDIVDLTACSGYAQAITRGLLPRYEFLLRDMSSGASFISFAKTLDVYKLLCFVQKTFAHLASFGLRPKELCMLEDSSWLEYQLDKAMIDFLVSQGIALKFIPSNPSSLPLSTAFHQFFELELYQKSPPETKPEFYQRALELQRAFNLKRKDYKHKVSPFVFVKRRLPGVPMVVMTFQPLCLDDCRYDGVNE